MSQPIRSTRPWVLTVTAALAVLLTGCGETVIEQAGPSLEQSRFEARAPSFRASAAIAAGSLHSCAILADGTARCWGDRSQGQLGDGSSIGSSLTPVQVSGLSAAVAVASSDNHGCSLRSDGTVRCWGSNSDGQLGDGTLNPSNVPVIVSGVSDAVAISVGDAHSCAVLANGQMRCWGDNSTGQLGDGTTSDRSTAQLVSGISSAIGVAAGGGHSCAMLASGLVRCWGDNSNGQLGDGTFYSPRLTPVAASGISSATAISAGRNHTCALIVGGKMRCWGDNSSGQLGDGTFDDRATPGSVGWLSYNVTSIAAGGDHSCTTHEDGTARCWGDGTDGGLGNGAAIDSAMPAAVTGVSNAVAITTGNLHGCALLAGGTLRCWGNNSAGQLGNGTAVASSTSVAVSGLSDALSGAKLTVGDYHACAVRPAGSVACWGRNDYGQLGDGTQADQNLPVVVSGLSNVVALASGYQHTCALRVDGTVACWGYNYYGQLGGGFSSLYHLTPTEVSGLTDAIAISAGRNHTCALRVTGGVSCWGSNSSGQLGNGTTLTSSDTPVSVLVNAVALVAGSYHNCAIIYDGTVRCWGENASGQLGDGTTDDSAMPRTPSGLSSVQSLSAGYQHTCALLSGGTVKCWGNDTYGQIGDNSVNSGNVLAPVAVSGLSNVASLGAGYQHGCAVLADGGARCWGKNTSGQLGDRSLTHRYTPVAVYGALMFEMNSAVVIGAGENHSCAMRSNGTVRCWGDNTYGQLGDGSNDPSQYAVTVSGFP